MLINSLKTFIQSILKLISEYPNTSFFIIVTAFFVYTYYCYYRRAHKFKRKIFRRFLNDHYAVIIVIYLIVLSVIVVNELSLNVDLKNSLIAEIVGGGIVSIVIAFTIQNIVERKEQRNQRRETIFKFEKILLELREAQLNDRESINFNDQFSFLLGTSHIMNLYEVCKKNSSDLIRCKFDFEDNTSFEEFVSEIITFYNLSTQVISKILKIDSILVNLARKINSSLGRSPSFDNDLLVYMRGHISGYSQKKVQPWVIGFSDIDRKNIELKISQNLELMKALKEVKRIKLKLLRIAREIKKEINTYPLD